MELTGCNLVAGEASLGSGTAFQAVDPATGKRLDPIYREATAREVDRAFLGAQAAFEVFAGMAPARRAAFLRAIADELMALGDAWLERAQLETALPPARLQGRPIWLAQEHRRD